MPDDTDMLNLFVRIHDPKEKRNPKLAASWASIKFPRADLALSPAEFAAKHVVPRVVELEHFKGR